MSIRNLAKSTVIYAMGNICLRLSSFLLIPFYTRLLPVAAYGQLSILLTTMTLFLILMGFGVEAAVIRFTKDYTTENRIQDLLVSVSILNILGGLIVFPIAVWGLSPLFSNLLRTNEASYLVFLTCLAAFVQSNCLNFLAYYRAEDRARKFLMVSISLAVLLVLFNLLFLLVFKQGVAGVMLAISISYGLILVAVLIDVFSKVGFSLTKSTLTTVFRFSYPMILIRASSILTDVASIYMISAFEDLETVAVYSLGAKLAMGLEIFLVLPFQLSYPPYVYNHLESPNIKKEIARILYYFIFTATIMCILGTLAAKFILPYIAPPTYGWAYTVMLLLLPISLLHGLSQYSTVFFHIENDTKTPAKINTLVAVVAVIFCFFLIRWWGWPGAVCAVIIPTVAGVVWSFRLGTQVYPMSYKNNLLGPLLGLFSAIIAALFFMRHLGAGAYLIASASTMALVALSGYFMGFHKPLGRLVGYQMED